MIVVSDTTPLISLLKINQLDLLEKLFGEVLIPEAVFNELTVDERFQLEAQLIRQKEFIAVKPVNNLESVSILKRATGLDQGESEAIVLTDELKAENAGSPKGGPACIYRRAAVAYHVGRQGLGKEKRHGSSHSYRFHQRPYR